MFKCSECGGEVKISTMMIQPLKEKIKCGGCGLTRMEENGEWELIVNMGDEGNKPEDKA